jgi:hypothetical protein
MLHAVDVLLDGLADLVVLLLKAPHLVFHLLVAPFLSTQPRLD